MDFESVVEKCRSEESIKLFKSLDLGDSVSSAVYLHALNVIGAISCLSRTSKSKMSKLEVAEQKLFWKALGEISLMHAKKDDSYYEDKSTALSSVLLSFPKAEATDDWLPLHFALSLQTIDPEITQTMLTAKPQSIRTPIVATNLWWLDYRWTQNGDLGDISALPALKPYHLACMRKEPCPGLIDQLCAFDANFATSEASDGSLPLHIAARCSNSVDLIRQLVDLHPEALTTKNRSGETPLHIINSNVNPVATEILKFLVQAAPEALRIENNNGNLPLHEFVCNDSADKTSITILLDAYPEALDIANNEGELPIQIAAKMSPMEVFQVIVEHTHPNHLDASVCHSAVSEGRLENLEYLYSLKPELLLQAFQGRTALHVAIQCFGRRGGNGAFIRAVASLAPEALAMTDDVGNNLAHTLVANLFITNEDDTVEETMRFLLRSIPGAAVAVNNEGQTPLDVLNAKNSDMDRGMAKKMKAIFSSLVSSAMGGEKKVSAADDDGGDDDELQVLDAILFVLRRLLLIAGAPSLHPELRKEMNYKARKDALFAFFGDRATAAGRNQSSSSFSFSVSGGPDILYRIRSGPGSVELMIHIVSFL